MSIPSESPDLAVEDRPEAIERDIAAVGRIGTVPGILHLLCENTRMGFAAVARVTDVAWTACAVKDDIGFGLRSGSQLDLNATLCKEAREIRRPVAFDKASDDPVFCKHPLPGLYGIESFVSVPIILRDGRYFGNLCAFDRHEAQVSSAPVVARFEAFAQLIANELDRAEREARVEAALSDANATAVLREQFIAVLGHDLRNPLAAVSSAADLMILRGDKIDVAATGRRIQVSARRMGRLIDDVLDFARGRLGSGMGVRRVRENDLESALLDVVSEIQATCPERDIHVDFEPFGPTVCDRARLQQLLSNLVGNAVHHGSASKPVSIKARVHAGTLTLSVENGGERIAPDHLTKIFEPYWRPPSSEPGGGLGLGLHICSQIAAAHGGRMEVESFPNGQTTFTALLPIAG